ncbi:MAG: hypothetical protein SXU28_11860 [Pseudomonadota bacterium]|nr:hypothetical protein [Pseudomonadota bacterium]
MSRREGILTGIIGLFAGLLKTEALNFDEGTIGALIPAQYRALLVSEQNGPEYSGIYLSGRFGYFRILAIRPDGTYRLFFWDTERETGNPMRMRDYQGRYFEEGTEEGDTRLILDIGYKDLSNGGDANDEALIVMQSGPTAYLLREDDFDRMAYSFREDAVMGDSEAYLVRVSLDDRYTEEPYDGRAVPPVGDLPVALRNRVLAEPITVTIIAVDEISSLEPYAENQNVLCTLDKGADDGLYMNMPLFSPEGTGRNLRGWVWQMDPDNCRAGVKYTVNEKGGVSDRPRIGDTLTSKPPETVESV